MEIYLLVAALVLLLVLILLQFYKSDSNKNPVKKEIDYLTMKLEAIESGIKRDASLQREEYQRTAREGREELSELFRNFQHAQQQEFKVFREMLKEQEDNADRQLVRLGELVENRLKDFNFLLKQEQGNLKDSMKLAMDAFKSAFDERMKSFNELQSEKMQNLEERQQEMIRNTAEKLEFIRSTVEEKLEKTLSDRLGQSFETVGKQLIEVQKGLGEMQSIASEVGGLKKVLSNVKLRGGVGEVQLSMLLEQMLAPTQYAANVKTKKGSNDPVEFAIKLPGRSDEEGDFVYLPIDAKFPKDIYENLVAAYDSGDSSIIEEASRQLTNYIKRMARTISEKYIDPPNTTDFAIMFLPFESIYAEVIRNSSLVDELHRDYKITVAGPTNLAAILNSLQMGFRSLAIQKRSSEVWKVLGEVKAEFEKFGGLLERAQNHIRRGLNDLDDIQGVRTRAINRKLRDVDSLPVSVEEKDGEQKLIE
jgi:DNA recombination protein RmuC